MDNTQELLDGAKIGDSTKATGTRTKPQKHGLSKLLKADYKELDGRCTPVAAMKQYQTDLLSSLGGRDTLSAQEITLVEMCSRDWLMLQSIDAYLLQASLFNKRKRTAYPLTIQRQTIADGLTRRLLALGLTKRARSVQTLTELLNAKPGPAQAVDAGT